MVTSDLLYDICGNVCSVLALSHPVKCVIEDKSSEEIYVLRQDGAARLVIWLDDDAEMMR